MPIYCYGCATCGLQQEMMQKISAMLLTAYHECGKGMFVEQFAAPVLTGNTVLASITGSA